jgi:hypothetical protein
MKELEVGDKVWVLCKVIEPCENLMKVTGSGDDSWFWADRDHCRPVESAPAKEPTEAQKLAERTMKAMWAANDAVNERPPSVEPPECPQGFRHLEKGEKILASDVPVVPSVEPAKVVFVVEPPPGLHWSPGDRVRIDADGGPFMRDAGIIKVVKPTYCDVVLDRNGQTYSFDTNRLKPESKPPTTSKDYYGPDISKVTFQFTQTPNTLGTTDPSGVGSEDITIHCEYQLPGEEPFFVIQSDSGWSFDDPESFLKLLLSVKEAEEKCRCSLPQS